LHKTLGEIYAMPASEFIGWQAYHMIYPFTFAQRDTNAALIAERVTNMLGSLIGIFIKHKPKLFNLTDFMPDYLAERRTPTANKTLDEQAAEFKAFHAKLKSKTAQGHKP
jgi:hypothetical protein